MTSLFTATTFRSHSGVALPFKIDCDALTDEDLETLAQRYAATVLGNVFGEVVGVPRGGLRFAEAIRRHVRIGGSITWRTNLIVDDVLTTGASMEAFWRERYPIRFSGIAGLVIFARAPCPSWVRPIFQLGDWIRP